MPPAIADSDDEGDDIDIVVAEQDDSGHPALGLGSNPKNREGATEAYAGTNENSTGSMGRTWTLKNTMTFN